MELTIEKLIKIVDNLRLSETIKLNIKNSKVRLTAKEKEYARGRESAFIEINNLLKQIPK